MKKLILTSAFILGSVITLFAQANKPGQPIGGIVVKGGKAEASTSGNVSPLYDAAGDTKANPVADKKTTSDMTSAGAQTNPYFKSNDNTGEMQSSVKGSPIGGIVVKGGKSEPAAVTTNPLYSGSNTETANPLYKGKN